MQRWKKGTILRDRDRKSLIVITGFTKNLDEPYYTFAILTEPSNYPYSIDKFRFDSMMDHAMEFMGHGGIAAELFG